MCVKEEKKNETVVRSRASIQFSFQSSDKLWNTICVIWDENDPYPQLHKKSYITKKLNKVKTPGIFLIDPVSYHFLHALVSSPVSSSGCYFAPNHKVLTTEDVLPAQCVPPILTLH